MTKTQALRLLVAAHDDPVLAAWASVVHEYKMPASCDVSPYEHWEAFQEFFSYGLITSVQYNSTDTKRIFFSGHKPPAIEVQRVLDALRILPDYQPLEPPMSKTKLPDNPFATSTMLTARDSGGLAAGHKAAELPARQSPSMLNPFADARETLPKSKDPIPMEAFSPRRGLACQDPKGVSVAHVGSQSIRVGVQCYGTSENPHPGEHVDMMVDDGHAIGPDDLPGGQVSVIEAIFHGKCPNPDCGMVLHCSAGKTIPQEAFR